MSNFRTMLAGTFTKGVPLRFPLLASPKLDGVRCHIIDGVAVSRNLKPFRNPEIQRMFGRAELNGLDGELMVGEPTSPTAFRQTGVLNSFDGDVSDVNLWVFDDFTHPMRVFHDRLKMAHRRCVQRSRQRPVDHELLHTLGEIESYEAECLALGYEGIMLRSLDGPYKHGRSTVREGYLLKVKQFLDSEAVIDDADELMHNENEKTLVSNGKAKRSSHAAGKVGGNTLGTIHVRDVHTGVEFSIGSGFDDAERAELWKDYVYGKLIGRVVKYRYFPTGSKDKPRFPTFLGFRTDL